MVIPFTVKDVAVVNVKVVPELIADVARRDENNLVGVGQRLEATGRKWNAGYFPLMT